MYAKSVNDPNAGHFIVKEIFCYKYLAGITWLAIGDKYRNDERDENDSMPKRQFEFQYLYSDWAMRRCFVGLVNEINISVFDCEMADFPFCIIRK